MEHPTFCFCLRPLNALILVQEKDSSGKKNISREVQEEQNNWSENL
jgi:hypothetical protein